MQILPIKVSNDLTIDAVYIYSISEYEDIYYAQNRLCIIRDESDDIVDYDKEGNPISGDRYLQRILVDYCTIPEADELLKLHHIEETCI